MIYSTQISIYSFWNGLELEKSQIYMQKHQNVYQSNKTGYPVRLSTSYIYEAKSQVDQYETGPDNLFDVIFYIYKLLKRPDGF